MRFYYKLLFVFAAFALKTLSSLIALRLVAGLFGEQGFGYITQYLAFLSVIFTLALGGAANYLVREFSIAKSTDEVSPYLQACLVYGLLFFVLFFLSFVALKGVVEKYVLYTSLPYWVIFYISSLYLLSGLTTIWMAAALGRGLYKEIFISSCLGCFVYVSLVYASVNIGSAWVVYWVLPLSYILPSVFLFKAHRVTMGLFRRSAQSVKLGAVFSFCLMVYAGVASVQLISMFARSWFLLERSPEILSNWQTAVKISDVIQQSYGVLCSAILLPYLSKNVKEFTVCRWASVLLGILFLFVCGGLIIYLFRGLIFRVLYGEGFVLGQSYLGYYLVGDVFRAGALFCVFTFIALGMHQRALTYEIAQGVIYLCCFKYFLGIGALFEAGYAYVVTYALCFGLMLFFSWCYFRR